MQEEDLDQEEVKAKGPGQRGAQRHLSTETQMRTKIRSERKKLGECSVQRSPPQDPQLSSSLAVSMSSRDLGIPVLCCGKNRGEGERGTPRLRDGKKRREQSTRVPSWSLAASVLPKLPPAECHFAIYLHVIIAMRCRY